jgi:quercetin dioxygenase-like cupin family protein
MKNFIHHLPFSEVPKISRGRGIVNHLIASKKIGASKIHSGITIIPPKTSVPAHSHNTEEQVTILKGTLKIILNGGKEVNCNRYDSTFITSNIEHELINETNEEVHAIIIYGSVDVNRTFSKTGLTVLIGSKEDNFTDK